MSAAFSRKIYPFEIFTRATPGGSLVYRYLNRKVVEIHFLSAFSKCNQCKVLCWAYSYWPIKISRAQSHVVIEAVTKMWLTAKISTSLEKL